MIYGYMRVSTVGQVKGNSLEEQERILRQNGAVILYQDAFTGTKTSRPNFNKLLEILQEGDTLVITKLDRFARNTVEGINVVQHLLEQNGLALSGVGENAARNLAEEVGRGPFFSIDDMKTRARLNKTAVEALSLAGVLAGLPESDQMTLF